jgi:hypothetical protein
MSLKLCKVLCVLVLVTGPALAMDPSPPAATAPTRPVVKKDGPKTPDAPETPTLTGAPHDPSPPTIQDAHPKTSRGVAAGNKTTATTNKNQQRNTGGAIKPATTTSGSQSTGKE